MCRYICIEQNLGKACETTLNMISNSPYDINRFVSVYDDLNITSDFCDKMIAEYERLLSCGSGHSPDHSSNKDEVSYYKSPKNEYMDKNLLKTITNSVSQALSKYCVLHPTISAFYSKGAFNDNYNIDYHIKKIIPSGQQSHWLPYSSHKHANRMINWIIFLNDMPDTEGGIEFMEFDMKIHPKQKRVVLFPVDWSFIYRENLTITKTQYVITGSFGYFPLMK